MSRLPKWAQLKLRSASLAELGAHMTPDYFEGEMWVCVSESGEGVLVPVEYFTEEQARDLAKSRPNDPTEDVDCKRVFGWWARLSARGYMDATDWMGPFDSEEDAMDALAEQYDVDPITGDDEDDEDEGGSSGGGVPFTLDGLGQHRIPLEEYDLGAGMRVIVWAAQLKPSPSLSIYKVELIRLDGHTNRAVVADQTTLAAPNAFEAAYSAAKNKFNLSISDLTYLWNTYSSPAPRRGGGGSSGGGAPGVPFTLDGHGAEHTPSHARRRRR